jgi:acyl carrier protein
MPTTTGFFGSDEPVRPQVLAGVKQIIAEFRSIPSDDIQESDDILIDLGMDSLDVVEAVMEAEDRFKITVPDELFQMRTVGEVTDSILRSIRP